MTVVAYLLLQELSRQLYDTELRTAQVSGPPLVMVKVAMRIAATVHGVAMHLPACYSCRDSGSAPRPRANGSRRTRLPIQHQLVRRKHRQEPSAWRVAQPHHARFDREAIMSTARPRCPPE